MEALTSGKGISEENVNETFALESAFSLIKKRIENSDIYYNGNCSEQAESLADEAVRT